MNRFLPVFLALSFFAADAYAGPGGTKHRPDSHQGADFKEFPVDRPVPAGIWQRLNPGVAQNGTAVYHDMGQGRNYIEVVAKRTMYTRYYVDPDAPAKFVQDQAYLPLNFRQRDGWRAIDVQLRPAASGVFEASEQEEPVGIDPNTAKSYIRTVNGEVGFNQWSLYGRNAGEIKKLAAADWSHRTVGSAGILITDIFPGIDAEMRVARGSVKTSFTVRRLAFSGFTDLLLQDQFSGLSGNGFSFAAADAGSTYAGAVWSGIGTEKQGLRVAPAVLYEKYSPGGAALVPYELDKDRLRIVLGTASLQQHLTNGPVVIDPLVQSTGSLSQSSVGTMYNSSCTWTNTCDYSISVTPPAAATITAVLSQIEVLATAPCGRQNIAYNVTQGACVSPSVGSFWIAPATVTGPGIMWTGFYTEDALLSCMPGPSCAPTPLNFTFRLARGCVGPTGCDNTCIGLNSPLAIRIEGRTVEYSNGIIASSDSVCYGNTIGVKAVPRYGKPPYATNNWSYSSTGAPSIGSGDSITLGVLNPGTYTVYVNTTDACGITAQASKTLKVNAIPSAPSISSNTPVCAGATLNLTAANVSGGTFSWTGPLGFTSAQQNPSIPNVTTAQGNNYSATVTVLGCTSPSATTAVVVNPIPATPVLGSNSPVCSGNTLNLTATNPSNGTITWSGPLAFGSAQQNPSIPNTTIGNGGTYGAFVTLNGCISPTANLAVTVNPTPVISSSASANPVTCGGTGTVTLNGLTPSTSYTVTYLKNTQSQTATITSSTGGVVTITGLTQGTYTNVGVSLNGCSSATVGPFTLTDPTAPAAPSVGSNTPVCQGTALNLTATGVAGATYSWNGPGFTSSAQNPTIANMQAANVGSYSVTQTVAGCMSAAATTVVSMNTVPAQPGVIAGNMKVCAGSAQVYRIARVANTTTYTWTVPGGWSGTSTDTALNATAAAAAGTGIISVTANNVCGSSAARTFADTVITTPVQPGVITGNTKVCGGSTQNYSIAAVNEATSYTWTLPTGWSGSSATNAIATTAATASGIGAITVSAVNACGTSPARSLADTVVNTPAQPGAITGNIAVCAGTPQTYSIVRVPEATSYTWTLPSTGNWSGTSTTDTIRATAGNVTGPYVITVKAVNQCGTSVGRDLAVNVTNIPAQPGVITGNTNICGTTVQPYNVAAVPEAASYVWTVPGSGWSITGVNNTAAISTLSGTVSGNISVAATNVCGTSPVRTLAVTVTNIPAQPAAILGNTSICAGTTQTYRIPKTAEATSYAWTATGNGWTQATGGTADTFVNATAGTSGILVSVTASNVCGTSPARTLAVGVTTVPAQPGIVTGRDSLCLGTGDLYTIAPVSGATSYNWTSPATGTWTGTTNSTQLGFNLTPTGTTPAGTYAVTVRAVNFCGNSPATTKNIVVNRPVTAAVTLSTTDTVICAGTPLVFTASSTNGGPAALYQWKINGNNNGTAGSAMTFIPTTINNSDVISVAMTSSMPCAVPQPAQSNGIRITVNPLVTPGISINSNYPSNIVCRNTPVIFNIATMTGAGTAPIFAWRKNGLPVGNGGTTYTDATLTTGDSVSVVMTTNATCATQPTRESNKIGHTVYTTISPAVSILVNPGTYITAGQSVTFTAQVSNAGPNPQYQWMKNNSAIAGATTATYTSNTLRNGDEITVQVGADLPCAAPGVVRAASKVMQIRGTSVSGVGAGNVSLGIYPNPTDGHFTISVHGYTPNRELHLSLVSIVGQTLYETTMKANQADWTTTIDLPASIAAGTYMVRFTNDQHETMLTQKLDLVR